MARTETVTLVFTDIVGSTELASKLGHERYEALRRGHFDLCRAAIAACNGTEIKSLGDGLMIGFGGAGDAVACAIAMQQASCSAIDDTAPVLQIRIGVSSGEATREGSDLYGPPVVEAARLCAKANGGQILASDVVKMLAKGKGFGFVSVGELSLKGLPEPVAAFEIKWEPPSAKAKSVPLPHRLQERQALKLHGREREVEVLAKAWAQACAGQRQLVFLAGEPGIGKTRLAIEFARDQHVQGATVLFGLCDEGVSVPYRPFVEALRHFIAHANEQVLTAHVREHQAELTRILPELRDRVAGIGVPQVAEADTKRFLLFEALLGLLNRASQEAPLIVILDDLQWADASDHLLLKHIVRSAVPARLLMIATYRDTDVGKDHAMTPVLADLRREANVQRLPLSGIGETAVEELLAESAQHELSEPGRALARALHQGTEGSPLFLAEILRSLVESGALRREEGVWSYRGDVAALGIPDGIREVVQRRVRRLSEGANTVLNPASVAGRQFEFSLLAKVAADPDVAGLNEDKVLSSLEEAEQASLVDEVGDAAESYSFTHGLIRSTLYDGLSAVRRRRLHRKIGEALEQPSRGNRGKDIDELAYHWLACSDESDNAKAIAYARGAAEKATGALAFETAASLYERALAILSPKDKAEELLRCDLLLALGDVQRSAGNAKFADTMSEAAAIARLHNDAHRLGVAALGSGHPGSVQWGNAVNPALVSRYSEAIAALGQSEPALRARLLGQLACELKYGPERERRHQLSATGLELARSSGDRLALAHGLSARIFAIEDPMTLIDRLPMTAELEAVAGAIGSHELGCLAARQRFVALLESGDADGAERALIRCEQLAQQLRVPFFDCFARFGRNMWSLMRGEPSAELQIFATFQLGTSIGLPQAMNGFLAQMFELRTRQGRLGEQLPSIRSTSSAHPDLSAFQAALIFALTETGALDEARDLMGKMAASKYDVPLDTNWPSTMNFLAEAISVLGDGAAAEALYARVLPVAEQVGVTAAVRCDGSFGTTAGMLAAACRQWAAAEAHFEHALAVNDRLKARPAQVRTRRAFAQLLIARNNPVDRARAAALIADAAQSAAALNMVAEVKTLEGMAAGV